AQTDRGKSRAPRRRVVPARRIHRDESPTPPSFRRAVLQQEGHGRAMDQRRQAGGALDATVLPPVPGERGPVAVDRAGLQPRESLAAAGVTGADRHLVADQSPAALRQDGRTAGQARRLLLAPAGRESSDTAAVWVDAPQKRAWPRAPAPAAERSMGRSRRTNWTSTL